MELLQPLDGPLGGRLGLDDPDDDVDGAQEVVWTAVQGADDMGMEEAAGGVEGRVVMAAVWAGFVAALAWRAARGRVTRVRHQGGGPGAGVGDSHMLAASAAADNEGMRRRSGCVVGVTGAHGGAQQAIVQR